MSARYVAVLGWRVGEVEAVGGIHNLSAGSRYYASPVCETAADAYEAARDTSAVVYDLDTGEQVDP